MQDIYASDDTTRSSGHKEDLLTGSKEELLQESVANSKGRSAESAGHLLEEDTEDKGHLHTGVADESSIENARG